MNREEIDIWLKHFADKQTGYQMFDENGMRREINFFIVFRYLKELQQKVNQLETNRDEAYKLLDDIDEYMLTEQHLKLVEAKKLLERGKE